MSLNVEQLDPKEKICTLCMDEMSLKTHLHYSIPSDTIVRLEDFGCGYWTNKVATSAMVMLCGKWKQPVGYFLVNGGCPSTIMEDLLKEAIDKLESIGLSTLVVMSDMGSNFYSLAIKLEITPEKPCFIYKDKKYFVIFDPPHLIKCIHNNLMKYTFRFGNYIANCQTAQQYIQQNLYGVPLVIRHSMCNS